MPQFSKQLLDAPYPDEYGLLDHSDALLFLYQDVAKVITGEVPLDKAIEFLKESTRGLPLITNNKTFPRLQLK